MLSASSYGHFTAAKEFWSQCHIFRFGNDRRSSRRGLLGRQNCHPRRRIGITGGGPPGGPPPLQHHLNPKLGGQRGEPEALSQPVDPGGVGGYPNCKMTGLCSSGLGFAFVCPKDIKRPLRDDFLTQNTISSAQKAPAGRFSGSKYNFIRPKGPCGTTFCYSQSEIYDIGSKLLLLQ